jgi:hypothetical protein
MWYAEDGIIDQGFVGYFSYSFCSLYLTFPTPFFQASTDVPSIDSLMKTGTKVNGMLSLRWEWGYATWDGQDAGIEGGLTLQCKEPKGEETITGKDISGVVSYGSEVNQAKVLNLTSSTERDGTASWELKVEWDRAGENLGYWMTLKWGKIKDKNGLPFLLAVIPGDRLATWAIGKRYPSALTYAEKEKVTILTPEEEEMLGVWISASDFKKYANDTFGVKHRYADHIEFDEMSDEDGDGETDEDEEEEEDDEDSENDGEGSEPGVQSKPPYCQ